VLNVFARRRSSFTTLGRVHLDYFSANWRRGRIPAQKSGGII
jgi:hypothetical protein